ncbi:MAG TPA: tyrosine-type recombinase/integrase [Caulobacteraceae bacterium]|nr:tyrosine-type recombinase/integrase [Caulobacteraceae bacterium]
MDEHAAEARDERPRHTYAEAVERFFAETSIKPRTKPILTLAVETEMRREELLGITVRSIDLERREIHLDKTKTNARAACP